MSVLARSAFELQASLDGFLAKYASFILDKNILITQSSPVYSRAYLQRDSKKSGFVYGVSLGCVSLDPVEEKILGAISNNARLSIIDLMESTGLTRDIVHYRLKKLKREGIIVNYRVDLDLNKIGRRLYKIILRLHSLSPKRERELRYFVEDNDFGVQYLKLMGSWDVELEFEVADEEQLHEILVDLRNRFSDVIRDYDTLLIYRNHKLDYFPFA